MISSLSFDFKFSFKQKLNFYFICYFKCVCKVKLKNINSFRANYNHEIHIFLKVNIKLLINKKYEIQLSVSGVKKKLKGPASGRLKKFEPLDTRDFVPFGEYDDLTIENIKEACEKYYQAPEGSCDILASDRGPSCTKLEQIKGKKGLLYSFPPTKVRYRPKSRSAIV